MKRPSIRNVMLRFSCIVSDTVMQEIAIGALPPYELLEQEPYTGGVTAAVQLSPPLQFGGLGLSDALRDDLSGLPNHDSPAFPDFVKLSQKLSVRIQVSPIFAWLGA